VPCAPVEDEDGDGGLLDEIPIDMNGNGTFLDDYDYPENPAAPPRYRDGNNREHMYYLATKDHEKNLELRAWVSSARYLDGEAPEEFPGLTAYDISPSGHAENIMEFGIPIYHRGGWMDGFTRGTFELYSTMKGKNPSRVIIDAGYHTGKGPFWKYLGERQKKVIRKINLERLRFFDRYLKGIDNGIDEEQPILIYVMNGVGWRSEKEWPLERRVETGFYFSEDKRLSRKQGPEGSDEYKADFTHDSRYGNRKANRYTALYSNIPDKLAVRTEKDKKCLVYETGPMVENMEVTGHPMVHLWVSSSADYGDFFVYLVDVDRAGEAVLVSEGMLRAGFAGLYDNDQMIYSGEIDVEVRPELPWHGYESGHYVDRILADGNIVELVIDLQPTSWVFRKGHKIRLAIACADWPTFRLHEKLAPKNHPDDPANIIPSITVYRDAEHPSQIILPVIPY
jgi:putative CocE/NonD family hydrolase